MKPVLLALCLLPAPCPQEALRKALSTPPASRPGHSDDWRRGTWMDALLDHAAANNVDIYRDGVGALLR